MPPSVLVLGCCLLLVVGPSARPSTPPPSALPATFAHLPAAIPPLVYSAPVAPLRVLRGFSPPSQPYGPGHRGVDLATVTGQPVRTAARGTVVFAGDVAGRGVVVIAHPDGLRTEYEPVRPAVAAGQALGGGAMIGTLAGTHGQCPEGGCLHWSARRGTHYLDPLGLLRPLGPVRLLPWGPSG